MKFLVIGVSNIVVKRVLPALGRLAEVEEVNLASRRSVGINLIPAGKDGTVFVGYEEALARLAGGIAYVSLPNSLHAFWVRRALEAGLHVVVDKPAALTVQEVEELVGLAERQRLCLAEATVWAYHPRFRALGELLTNLGETITRVSAMFSFPPLARDDFRNDQKMGGGCIFDLGPYAASCARHFFGEPPDEVLARVLTRDQDTGLETSFSLLATYPGGRAMAGHFGFNTEYRNALSLLGPGIAVDVERAFTLPADLAAPLSWRRRNQQDTLTCPAGDGFALFLEAVMQAIRAQNWKQFAAAMLADARFIEQIRTFK